MNNSADQKVAEHFDSMAGVYADSYSNGTFVSSFFDQRLKIVSNLLKNCDRARVLDVGCGPGMMARHSIERGFEFFGIDISEKMIGACVHQFGQMDSAHFSVGNLQSLKFPDAFFDVVLCMGALEYVGQEEVEGAVSEMIRVLKPDGLVILSLMYRNSFFAWHRRLANSIKGRITGRKYDAESYDGLSRAFEEKPFLNLLSSRHRLNEIETEFFGLNVFPSFLETRLPDKLKIMAGRVLGGVVKGLLKWPYMAFIVKAKK